MKKNFFYLLSLISLLFLSLPLSSQASGIRSGEEIYLAENETISGNIYVTAQNIIINGEIEGDLIALSKNIIINGRLDGDLIAIAQNIEINGEINGNTRVIANDLLIKGLIARNINFFGTNFNILDQAEINWDILAITNNATINGKIKGNIDLFTNNSKINGQIDGNVKIRNNKNSSIVIYPEAIIAGDLYYHENSNFTRHDQSQISGLTYKLPNKTISNKNIFPWWQLFIYKIISAFFIALIIIKLNKHYLSELSQKIFKKGWTKLFWGLLIIILSPMIILLLFLTIIGVPLAIIISSLYLIAFFVTKIIAAVFLGKEILKHSKLKNKRNIYLQTILGLIILFSLTSLPFVGWLISIIFSSFALGSILINIKK